ncbi:MAG: FKBP-type peptidyl-prolyl cis-trans isomerase [Myxococcales bacterium]|nr:FKBP-type peptidyl-prolyl cis-trans isomerase [Myxococcales bacterium]
MKRFLLILACALLLAFAACNRASKKKADDDKGAPAAEAAAMSVDPAAAGAPDLAAPPDVKAPPPDADKTPSGLATKLLKAGSGDKKPAEYDSVKVHYTGWTTDGKMFDSSRKRGQPATFAVKGVIPGWTEGLQLMKVGEQRRMWIPEALAYKGRPGSPQGMLVFDVELMEIIAGVAPTPAPPDVAAAPADAQKTKTGLAYKVLTASGSKEKPNAWDKVTVQYTGWTTDGKMFDSSQKRGKAATFPLNRVIPGWTEGVQLMAKGDSYRFWVPEELAYKGRPGAPQGTLVFDVELQEIESQPKPPDPPPVPKDVAAPPARAKKTDSGLSYVVLKKGKGGEKPSADSRVEVHYAGWTTDGNMFDSSITRGKPMTFAVNRVIPGWTEAVQLMGVGDKFRVWIPEELAYKGRPGAPQGMLVFEVELLKILEAAPNPHMAMPRMSSPPPQSSAKAPAPPTGAKAPAPPTGAQNTSASH